MRLFTPSGRATRLSEIYSKVAHVFCTTDLNSSAPLYFSTAGQHAVSPVWGKADKRCAGKIFLHDAVRASAAFPGGIPAKRLKLRELGFAQTERQVIQGRQDPTLRRGRQAPAAIYLADGGVWNNLGSDWFGFGTRSALAAALEPDPPSHLLMVDASAPALPRASLWPLRVPWLAEVALLLRVLEVSHTSTVWSRVERLRSDEGRKVDSQAVPPMTSSISMMAPLQEGPLRFAWFEGRKRWRVWRLADAPQWSSLVPTTLFRLSKQTALQLVLHGCCAAAHRFSDAVPVAPLDVTARREGAAAVVTSDVADLRHLDKSVVLHRI